jgi:hypothetical protein
VVTGTVTWSSNTGCGTTNVTSGNPGTATCTTSSLGGGNDVITAMYSGDSNHNSSTGTLTGGQVVNPASQTISCSGIPPSATYNTSFTASCTASSGLTVGYSSSGGCTDGSTSTYTMTSGTTACSVIANQAGNNNYSAAPQFSQSVRATKASQTITATPPNEAYKNDSFIVSATGGASGNALTFISSGDCTNDVANYTMGTGAGTCSGTINQTGNNNYAAATPYTWNTTVITTLNTPAVTLTGAPSSAFSQTTFVVTATYPTQQGVTPPVPTITGSGACSAGSVSGSGNTYTATITMTKGTGTCTAKATWAANFYYASATATETTTAELVTPTVTFTGAPGSDMNGNTFVVTATSNETGSLAATPTITGSGACTAGAVSGSGSTYQATITMTKGTGTCTTKAAWAATAEYAAETLQQMTTAQ